MMREKFDLGSVFVTKSIGKELSSGGALSRGLEEVISQCLRQYECGFWGDISYKDRCKNNQVLGSKGMLFGRFKARYLEVLFVTCSEPVTKTIIFSSDDFLCSRCREALRMGTLEDIRYWLDEYRCRSCGLKNQGRSRGDLLQRYRKRYPATTTFELSQSKGV